MHTRRLASRVNPSRAIPVGALAAVCALVLLPPAFTSAEPAAEAAVAQRVGGRVTPTPTPRTTPNKATVKTTRPTPRTVKPAKPLPKPGPTPRSAATAPAKPRQIAPQIEMVLIPSGEFMMGSPDSEPKRNTDEGPQHRVTVQSFYIGKHEVTQAQWRAVMNSNPSFFSGCDDCPVEQVSWYDAKEFCRRLSQMTGKEYRLPTEAEWEYAARAGTTTPFTFGSSLSSSQANFDGTAPQYDGTPKEINRRKVTGLQRVDPSPEAPKPVAGGVNRQKTTPVGSFQPNAFGLFDVHGNVSEWCEDIYHFNYHNAPTDGSAWVIHGNPAYRISRGGSWESWAWHCRIAMRGRRLPDYRSSNGGFRLAATSHP